MWEYSYVFVILILFPLHIYSSVTLSVWFAWRIIYWNLGYMQICWVSRVLGDEPKRLEIKSFSSQLKKRGVMMWWCGIQGPGFGSREIWL